MNDELPDLTEAEVTLLLFGEEAEARAFQRERRRRQRMPVDGAGLRQPAMRGAHKKVGGKAPASPGRS